MTALPAQPEPQSGTDTDGLSNRSILNLYWPLALSWILMSVEAPVCSRVVSAHADAAPINLAAYQIFFTLAMWFESPVIDLLSTSTTLIKGRLTHQKLRRYTLGLMALVTAVHALVAFTPLFEWICRTVLDVDPAVSRAARPGFVAMLPWSAAIGWRRYLQGILISRGETRSVGFGTLVRVGSVAASAFLLSQATHIPPSVVVGLVLVAGVTAEGAFIHFASREAVRRTDLIDDSASADSLTFSRLSGFHIPLTLTTLVSLCSSPSVAAAIDRLPAPIATLAAFQLSGSFLWLLRSFTYALPEVVITLYRGEASARALYRFSLKVGVIASLVTGLVGVSGLAILYFHEALGAPEDVSRIAAYGVLLGVAMPVTAAAQSYIRGMLTAHHLTVSRFIATGVGIAVLVAGLVLGVQMRLNGMVVSTLSLTTSMIAELIVLALFWRSSQSKFANPS